MAEARLSEHGNIVATCRRARTRLGWVVEPWLWGEQRGRETWDMGQGKCEGVLCRYVIRGGCGSRKKEMKCRRMSGTGEEGDELNGVRMCATEAASAACRLYAYLGA